MKIIYSNLGGYASDADGISAPAIVCKAFQNVNQTKNAEEQTSFFGRLKARFLSLPCLTILIATASWSNVFEQTC